MNGFVLMAEAIHSQLQTSYQSMVTIAGAAITYVPSYLSKREASLAQIHADVEQFLIATLSGQSDSAARAAQWSEQKEIDSSSMHTWTGQLNTVIENLKNEVELNQINLEKIVLVQSDVNGATRALTTLIGSGILQG